MQNDGWLMRYTGMTRLGGVRAALRRIVATRSTLTEPRQKLRMMMCTALVLAGCASANTPEVPSEPQGTGTVSGSVDGRSFDEVAAAYIIGKPDDPVQTTVIYVFDTPIGCNQIDMTGWDETVPDQSQSIEIKLIGTSAGEYLVAADGRPSTGECDANYTVTSTSGTPSEVSATAGSVLLTSIDGTSAATGTFDLTIPGGSVTGTFAADACARGREP